MANEGQKTGFEEEPQGSAHDALLTPAYCAPVTALIGEGGRLVIPAEIRKVMGLRTGDTVSLRIEDGVLRVVSPKMALKRIQDIARRLKKPGEGVVDEFLADRRDEQRRSDERLDRLEREAAEAAGTKKRRT